MALREIIFRGKRLGKGEWVEGFFAEKKDPLLESDVRNAFILAQARGDFFATWFPVDPSTVGQYTGLRDKNGKRIFEGDMVSTDIERPYLIVEFRDGCFMFNCNDGGEDYYDIMLPILKDPQSVYKYGEVIGNIHDNPELLEVSEND